MNKETNAAGSRSVTDADEWFHEHVGEAESSEPQMSSNVDLTTAVAQEGKIPAVEPWNWLRWCVAVWLLVTGLLTGRLVYSLLALHRFVKGCSATSLEAANLIERVASQLGMKRCVHVVMSNPDAMPMMCWLGRWILVLPSNFAKWSVTMQETTLVHELGHIARRDAWSDLLAQCVFCSLWPNPFSWLSMQLLRRLRERACDEWALQKSTIDVKTYAQCLQEVVRR